MRKSLIICVVLVIAVALTASLAPAATAPATRTVKVGDNWFYRDTDGVPVLHVKLNSRVRFHFIGDDVHDVWGYRGSKKKFQSAIKSTGYYKTPKLTRTGTYKFICNIHGEDDQSMKVIVRK